MINTIDAAQRKAARIAGLAYILTFAVVVYVNFAIHERLIDDSAVKTAQNILANQQLYRIGMAGDVVFSAGIFVLLTALYVVLKRVNGGLAVLSAVFRAVWALMWIVMTLQLFDAFEVITGTHTLQSLELQQRQDLAQFFLNTRSDQYYVGLLFDGLAATLCGWLWFRSRYIPRILALMSVVASAWCVGCTFAFYINPGIVHIVNLWWFDTPLGVMELVIGLWLLVAGLPRMAAGEQAKLG